MNAGQFITQYNSNTFSDEYKDRSEFLEYFKKTYPEEYRKHRDKVNKRRREYMKKIKVENPEKYDIWRKKNNIRLLEKYHKDKTWYQNYYKEYIKNPINREKNNKRSKEWYWKNKEKDKIKEDEIDINFLDEVKEKIKRKPALKIDKLENPIVINFSL